ncbi:LuxR C-terminal-related transcriptional regulator [Amycolatopsis sp. NPDC059021]|uniref:LuxR C-terminal-related transcriptional regulator n=1 Tax=Amycolatopsis sp. NPDC059021 TaxID=3346704 RepID=UPI00366A6925
MVRLRHSEALNQLSGLAADAFNESGTLVVVRGGPGSGKTKLVHDFAGIVADTGALFLGAAGARAETNIRSGIIDQLFYGGGLPAEVTARAWELLATDERDRVGKHEMRLTRELCAVLLELAKGWPLVIAVDDVHFGDPQSQQLLLSLQRRLASAPILLVVTMWDRPHVPDPLFIAELTRRPHHHIRLARLGVEEVAHLADAAGAAETPLPAADLHRISGGNALLARALILDHSVATTFGQETVERPVVGMEFRHAVLACLGRWDDQLLDVARGLAVFGSMGPEQVGRLVAVTAEDVEQASAVLAEAGFLVDGRFRHPAVRDAVLDSMSADQRAELHQRAADLRYRRGGPAIDVAEHLVAAERVPAGWGVALLRDAGEQALAGDRVRFAVRCLGLALRDCREEATRTGLTATLARAQWRLDPNEAMAHLPVLRAAMSDDSISGRDVLSAIRSVLWTGDADDIGEVLRVARDRGLLHDPLTAAELGLTYRLLLGTSSDVFPDDDPGDIADPWTQAVVALAGLWTHGAAEEAAASAEQILRSYCLGDGTMAVVSSALFALAFANRPDSAAAWCDKLIDEAKRRGSPTWCAIFQYIRAEAALRAGDLLAAEAAITAVVNPTAARTWGAFVGYPVAVALGVYDRLGRHEEAAAVLAAVPVPKSMHTTVPGMRYLLARGHHMLATDRVFAAVHDFETVGRFARKGKVDFPPLLPWRAGLAMAYLRLKRTAEAHEFLTQQLGRGAYLDARTKGISLRLLAQTGDPARRPALLEQAVAALRESGDRHELGRALADLSGVYRQLGEHNRAEQTARAATAEKKASLAAPAGGRPKPKLATAVAAPVDLRRTAEPAFRASLSKAERRVAQLAAKGHSNREIARSLYITVSTVEQHLTRVYRKLRTNNRAELSTVLDSA